MDIHLLDHTCERCGRRFFNLRLHNCPLPSRQPGSGSLGPENLELGAFQETLSSQRGIIKTFTYQNLDRVVDLTEFFDRLNTNISSIIHQCINYFASVRVQFTVHVFLIHDRTNDIVHPSFNSPFYTISHPNFIPEALFNSVSYIINSLNVVNERKSGWAILRIDKMELVVAKNPPVRGGSASYWRPSEFKGKRGLCDMNTPSEYCFIYAVLASLHSKELEARERHNWINYNCFKRQYNFECLTFPVRPTEVSRWEELNSVCVNIFTHEGKNIYPMRMSAKKFNKRACLLYCLNSEKDEYHYIAITDFNGLVGEEAVHRHHFCFYCLNKFVSEERCKTHMAECAGYGGQVIKFPPLNSDGTPSYKEFKELSKTMILPFVAFADLETLLCPLSAAEAQALAGCGRVTEYKKKLDCMSWGLLLCEPGGKYQYKDYAGKDAMKKFLWECLQFADYAISRMKEDEGMCEQTPEEVLANQEVEICPYCKRNFDDEGLTRIRHHVHLRDVGGPPNANSNGITITCNACNLKLKYRHVLTVTLHSGSRFDFKEISKGFKYDFIKKIEVVPRNSETFVSIIINRKVKFIDSFSKLPASLTSLVDITRRNGLQAFNYTLKEFSSYSDNFGDLVSKQILCYDWFTSLDCLQATSLPSKEMFWNSLRENSITDEEYVHAQSMWNLLQCKTMKDYLLFYQKLDVFLLCDVSIQFRDEAYARYGIDPMHYVSGASYSFSACLYKTRARFEHLHDIELLRALQKGVMGGVVLLNDRYAEANLPEYGDYDVTKPAQALYFFDFNSLYSKIMEEPHPCGGYQRLTSAEIELLSSNNFETLRNFNVPDEGFLLVVDFHIPVSLHDKFRYLPPGPSKVKVTRNMLSKHQIKLLENYATDLSAPLTSDRLLLTLYPKTNYVIHSQLLQYYMKIGVVLDKISDGWKFKQSDQIKSYILQNVKERAEANNEITKSLIKYMLNSTYGFSLRSKWLDVNVKVAKNPIDAEKLLRHPCFKGLIQIDQTVTLFTLKPHTVVMDLPYALGWSILSLSKLRLYRYYYSELTPLFDNRQFKALYIDTDSILFTVSLLPGETSVNHVLKQRPDLFDFSNYPVDHDLYDPSNRMVSGLLKSEYPCTDIKAFVGLSPKCYAIKAYGGEKDKVKGKGVARYKLAQISFNDYYDTLMNQNIKRVSMNLIKTKNQQMYIVSLSKVSLHCLQLKNYYLDEKMIESVPYGHYKTFDN